MSKNVVVLHNAKSQLEREFHRLAFARQVKVGNTMFSEFARAMVTDPTLLSDGELSFLKLAANYTSMGDLSKYHITTSTLCPLPANSKFFSKAVLSNAEMFGPSDSE